MKKTYEELEQEVEQLRAQLAPYLERDKQEEHRRQVVAKTEHIVSVLFPGGEHSNNKQFPKEVRHPEKFWWWNDCSIEEIGEQNLHGDLTVELESYVGDGEYEKANIKILGSWLLIDDYTEITKAVQNWCRAEHQKQDEKEREKLRRERQAALVEAQAKVEQLKKELG